MTDDALMELEQADVGALFGGTDEIFAITSDEEHAYNTLTEIWFLPNTGEPKRLLTIPGVYQHFVGAGAGKAAGVFVARETYDGVRAETKGAVQEFYIWNRETKSLALQAR